MDTVMASSDTLIPCQHITSQPCPAVVAFRWSAGFFPRFSVGIRHEVGRGGAFV